MLYVQEGGDHAYRMVKAALQRHKLGPSYKKKEGDADLMEPRITYEKAQEVLRAYSAIMDEN